MFPAEIKPKCHGKKATELSAAMDSVVATRDDLRGLRTTLSYSKRKTGVAACRRGLGNWTHLLTPFPFNVFIRTSVYIRKMFD
jgi:hypothetical protein